MANEFFKPTPIYDSLVGEEKAREEKFCQDLEDIFFIFHRFRKTTIMGRYVYRARYVYHCIHDTRYEREAIYEGEAKPTHMDFSKQVYDLN